MVIKGNNKTYDEECSICMNTIKDKFQTKCEHNFCKSCLRQWLEKNNSCPLCRKVLIDNSNKNLTIDTTIIEPMIIPWSPRTYSTRTQEFWNNIETIGFNILERTQIILNRQTETETQTETNSDPN
tara:strand:- start:1039 stop:1416 length:378 start_codon:yes stop_codon:yes gene_type:complete